MEQQNYKYESIDFKSMLSSEKQKREELVIKDITRETLFNSLQDMRPILIIDIRPKEEFNKCRVRNSIFIERDKDFELNLRKQIDHDAITNEKKKDAFRRLIIVDNKKLTNEDKYHQLIAEILETRKYFNKVFMVSDGLKPFLEKYPFLCMKTEENDHGKLLFAMARFPSEVENNALYIGNMTNALNLKQLRLLGIKSVVSLTPEKFADLEANFDYHHFQLNEVDRPYIDFDVILGKIRELIADKKGPIFLFCLTGMMSAATAALYLRTKKKLSNEIAMALVMARRPEIESMPAWLFMQVQDYKEMPSKTTEK